MGKSGRNEKRKVAAQYLNGIALAILVSGALAPILAGTVNLGIVAAAVAASVALHFGARRAVVDTED